MINTENDSPSSELVNWREDEDAAAVLAVMELLAARTAPSARTALTARTGPATCDTPAASLWGDPAHLLAHAATVAVSGWWASGLPR